MNRQIPPELQRQVDEALRTGKPLPPGVVAIGPGQQPPPGMVPIAQGGSQAGPANTNPLPPGKEGTQILRAKCQCAIAEDTGRLNRLLDAALKTFKFDDPGTETLLQESVAKGVVVALGMDHYCEQQTKRRTAITFASVPALQEVHDRLKALQVEAVAVHTRLQELVEQGKACLETRWELAVKHGGLTPEKSNYLIDEDVGEVLHVSLDCATCEGAVKIRKARQKLEESL